MARQQFAVRVEAVNIYDNIFDNNQLSVVRGGGLLLRDAIVRLDAWGRNDSGWQGWEKVTVGASIGEFRLWADSGAEQQIEERIAAWLSADEYYRFLTFAVGAIALGGAAEAETDREKLLARLRWAQQMQPRIAFEATAESAGPCSVTHIRHISSGFQVHGQPSSASAARRFEAGRAAKSGGRSDARLADFYYTETDPRFHRRLQQLAFAVDMADIAEDPSRHTLHNKVAVFYADGNRFSRLVAEANALPDLPTADGGRLAALSALDHDIQRKRRQLLTELLEWADAMPGMRFGAGGLRLEVLLWGGDELILVVPAWAGYSLLEKFFEFTATWEPQLRDGDTIHAAASKELCRRLAASDKPALSAQGRMTHAAGLVFTHAKTPLYITRRLANELADAAKQTLAQETRNVYQVLALESIDYPGEALDDFQRKRLPGALSEQPRTFLGPQPAPAIPHGALAALRQALAGVPRSQVHALVEALVQDAAAAHAGNGGESEPADDPVQRRRDRLSEMLRDDPGGTDETVLVEALARLFSPFPAGAAENAPPGIAALPPLTWIQLRELWDYLIADPAQATPAEEVEAVA